jgi:hypothetical protein
MTTSTEWHVPERVLQTYATDPRALSDVAATSAEAHLLTCGACRARVASAVPRRDVDASWAAIADVIDRPSRSIVQRGLELLGLRPEAARLAAATPSLQLAWVCCVAAVTAMAVGVSDQRDLHGPFLVLAPIVPLASVAIAFLPGGEPGGEAGYAAPISGLSLVLRRGVAVILSSMLVLLAGSLALPGVATADAAWVLPSLALTLGALAAGTRWPIEHAAGTFAVGWLGTIGLAQTIGHGAQLPESVLFTTVGQLCALAFAAVATVILVARRDHLALLGES